MTPPPLRLGSESESPTERNEPEQRVAAESRLPVLPGAVVVRPLDVGLVVVAVLESRAVAPHQVAEVEAGEGCDYQHVGHAQEVGERHHEKPEIADLS